MKKAIREKVWNKYNKHCAYCGCDLEYKDMQVDHFFPQFLSNGVAINNFANLMPSCRGCNFYKGTKLIENFRDDLQTLHERISKPFISRLGLKYGIIELKPFVGEFYYEQYEEENTDKVD